MMHISLDAALLAAWYPTQFFSNFFSGCIHFYFSLPRFVKIAENFMLVINGKIILIHINTHTHTHIYIYGRCIYVKYLNYVLVTCSLLTLVTLSQLAIKLVYLDALCLSSGYKEVSVLLRHSTERVAKTDFNCPIFHQFLSIRSKMHNLLGLFNIS